MNYEILVDLDEDSTEETVREYIAESLTDGDVEVNADQIELVGVALTDVSLPSDYIGEYETLGGIFTFANGYCQCDQDADVVCAALYLSIEGDNIDEAYVGEYSSDENFARETADQLGATDKNAIWPNNCIDWEYAAKELMYDYCEQDGFYFRNL